MQKKNVNSSYIYYCATIDDGNNAEICPVKMLDNFITYHFGRCMYKIVTVSYGE
jgi:hypothetical protein